MSEAIRRADTSRGILRWHVSSLLVTLDDMLRTRSPDRGVDGFIESTTARSKFRGYWDSMREAGHKCHERHPADIAL
jgi:hypothetical protein